ncbi:MAG: hypothetical protein KF862_07090 [Chitinophagaceae bacterium]|nr:hypothetical protein [Chitinophagaceae bacterium]
MPIYRFTILLRDKQKPISGIREIASTDIDQVHRTYRQRAEAKYTEYRILSFEVVMISKLSPEGKMYLKKAKRPPAE